MRNLLWHFQTPSFGTLRSSTWGMAISFSDTGHLKGGPLDLFKMQEEFLWISQQIFFLEESQTVWLPTSKCISVHKHDSLWHQSYLIVCTAIWILNRLSHAWVCFASSNTIYVNTPNPISCKNALIIKLARSHSVCLNSIYTWLYHCCVYWHQNTLRL